MNSYFCPALQPRARSLGRSGQHISNSKLKKPDAEFRRMLPAFHHRVRPRTLVTSVGIAFHVTLHVAHVNVFQRRLPDFDGSDVWALLEFSNL